MAAIESRSQLSGGILLSPELIEEYLEYLMETGCAPDTQEAYQSKLHQLYQYLPENKCIQAGTLSQWRESLLEAGYAPRTVNVCTAAANGLMAFCGHREFQVEKQLKLQQDIQPELTRTEYLRLLSTARLLGKEREYLLIKLFGATGLTLRDLPRLTVEAVQDGKVGLPASVIRIPNCLQEELLDYIQRERIVSGPVFVTKAGNPIRRNNITRMIQGICKDARVPEEKANPRCLKKLYQATQDNIQANISLLVEQAHDHLLETEQLTIGWKQEVGTL